MMRVNETARPEEIDIIDPEKSHLEHTDGDGLEALVGRREVLHSRLDYMIQFLEVVQTSGRDFPPNTYLDVLNTFKKTQSWQKQSPSLDEINSKIKELDDYMTEATKHFH